jgi:Domain of unknown function (DUF4394)
VSSKTKRRAALALAAAAVLVSAGSAQAAESEKVYAVTETGNMLLSFQSDAPGTVNTIGPIGVPGGETVLGIDAQPATGRLFAITSASKVYTVDKATGGQRRSAPPRSRPTSWARRTASTSTPSRTRSASSPTPSRTCGSAR